METKITSSYNPLDIEEKIYQKWLKNNFFNPDKIKNKKAKKFIVYMPLPNVTGTLHMGHTLNNTLQDILIRYYRLKGYKSLWFPGTDHAGIATQYIVEKELKKENLSRFDLGREKFIQRILDWKDKYGNIILNQLKRLGCSADWSRNRFTMDKNYSQDVLKAFVQYYQKGLIYRGLRTVNWCPRCQTTLSELELEYEKENTQLYYIKYGPLIVATTRPETKFGDTALAINPKDERYKKYLNQEIEIEDIDIDDISIEPRIKKYKLKVVADSIIDPKFGTGVLKVTPAHDITDFEISQRHNLEIKQIINEYGKINEKVKRYQNLSTFEARNKVVEDLKKLNLLIKTENYEHNIIKCYRCNHIIEPIPSKQWFLKMKNLAKLAINAVKSKKITIQPKNFQKPYFQWLNNIRDWAISRQIWWGHQLPVWFCQNNENNFIVQLNKPKKCPFCNNCSMEQSPDVLDTWFSSALWPFAGLSKKDLKEYFPGDVLITARDIINLWVARMIFSTLFFYKKIPFKKVYINGTILTKEGKRMSKSKGTGIDPMNYINQFGADATRFAVVWQANNQDIRWDENALITGKKFNNKIWNASRYILLQLEQNKIKFDRLKLKFSSQTSADKDIYKKLKQTKKEVEKYLDQFKFAKALNKIYHFFWHEFCDKYIEQSKKQITDEKLKKATLENLIYILLQNLILIHPFLPFISEEIYQKLPLKNKTFLIIEKWQ